MRRDYFTCVFLASIAGALLFVCFEPLYLKYGGVVYREFGLVESISSVFYAVAFLIAIPLFAGYKRKYWIAVGLACYGVLAYLPSIFYPKQVLITGESASIFHVIIAMILRGIYGMVNAPFAPLSRLWGDEVAASMSKWILPMAVLIPLIIRTIRFYRDAYVAEQLNPASVVGAKSNSKFDRKTKEDKAEEKKPEVLGTVISAPVKPSAKEAEPETQTPEIEGSKEEKKLIETDKVELDKIEAPETEDVIALPAPSKPVSSEGKGSIRVPSISGDMFKSDDSAEPE